jgi:hypothetical protein
MKNIFDICYYLFDFLIRMNKKTETNHYIKFFAVATFVSVALASLVFLSRQSRRLVVVYIPQHSDHCSNFFTPSFSTSLARSLTDFSTSLVHSFINFSTYVAHSLINFSSSITNRCIKFELAPTSSCRHSFKFFDFKFLISD